MTKIANYKGAREKLYSLFRKNCMKRILFLEHEEVAQSLSSEIIKECLLETSITSNSSNVFISFCWKEYGVIELEDIFNKIGDKLGWENLPTLNNIKNNKTQYSSINLEHINFEGNNNRINVSNEFIQNIEYRGQMTKALFDDIKKLKKPIIIIFDTYELSSDEVKKWVDRLLTFLVSEEKLRIVITGINISNYTDSGIDSYCNKIILNGIVKDTSHWLPVLDCLNIAYTKDFSESFFENLCVNSKGNYDLIYNFIKIQYEESQES